MDAEKGGMWLDILEVSQKQAYIFTSNALKTNVERSSQIAWMTESDFFEKVVMDPCLYTEAENLVYAGGGHTVLQFRSEDKAKEFNFHLTKAVHSLYPDAELFAAIIEYDSNKSPAENVKALKEKLEKKKAVRRASFHQGTFGVEMIDTGTKKPIMVVEKGSANPLSSLRRAVEDGRKNLLKKADAATIPVGYKQPYYFGDIGGEKGIANYIAVVHIDGNGMGSRVAEYYDEIGRGTWEEFRKGARLFSEQIDRDFKAAFLEMTENVQEQIEKGTLKDLELKEGMLPVRRIITSGDDICFVTEGRIGIECASAFLRSLACKKDLQGNPYSACAGVVIVHQKYPFFRAYELAENLCGNAKKFGAKLSPEDNGRSVSSIDWHLELGEIQDTVDDIRSNYRTQDGMQLEMRPYIVTADDATLRKEPYRQYSKFVQVIRKYRGGGENEIGGKLKELRGVLKRGKAATEHYVHIHKLEDLGLESFQGIFEDIDYTKIPDGTGLERKMFLKTSDGVERAILFDTAEITDAFILFEE